MFCPSGGGTAGSEKEESGSCTGYGHNCIPLNFLEQWLLAVSDFKMGCGLTCLSEKLTGFGSN